MLYTCVTLEGFPAMLSTVPSPQLIVHSVMVSGPGSEAARLRVYGAPSTMVVAPVADRVGAVLRTVRVVDVATDSGFSFGTERELPIAGHVTFNDSRDYDITPDGQHFLMIFPQETDSAGSLTQRINIVQNWFEELKERVPVP